MYKFMTASLLTMVILNALSAIVLTIIGLMSGFTQAILVVILFNVLVAFFCNIVRGLLILQDEMERS